MFAFKDSFILEQFGSKAPDVLAPFEKLKAPAKSSFRTVKGLRILDAWPGLAEAYKKTPSVSFDYAIAEKCRETVMVRAGFDWIDIGNWEEYAVLLGDTGAEVYRSASESCFVDSDIPVALGGVEDLIVVVRSGRDGGAPGVMITRKGETQRVRDLVEQIRAAGRTELL
jgi:mannose-1-phosphate guanylyltransferase/mannose-1-phosphate guanylyltransferase/mannose-6-phosphate isomerase